VSRIFATASSNFSALASLASVLEEVQEQCDGKFADRSEYEMEREDEDEEDEEGGRKGGVWPSSRWLTINRWWAPNPDALSDEIRLFVER
jgi:hypothetical protein